MPDAEIRRHVHETSRHVSAFVEAGRSDGPLMIFLHGWASVGAIWQHQVTHFAAQGWRCVAPDMRGYGGSSVPTELSAYAMSEIVEDMIELHDALGGAPAVWVGHDWGAEVGWSIAAEHPNRCRAIVAFVVPYLPGGFTFESLLPLVNRKLYPSEDFPLGQWDYMRYAINEPGAIKAEMEADLAATFIALYRAGDPTVVGAPALTADVTGQGGFFGPGGAPLLERDDRVLSAELLGTLVDAFEETGWFGAFAWYTNAAATSDTRSGRWPDRADPAMPVLFVHAVLDRADDTLDSPLANPMRLACTDLTEVVYNTGHWVYLEEAEEVDATIAGWLERKALEPGP